MLCITCVWVGVDSAWVQEKPEARKMLLNRAESHTSGATMMMASNHFLQEDGNLRPENALLGVFMLLSRFYHSTPLALGW